MLPLPLKRALQQYERHKFLVTIHGLVLVSVSLQLLVQALLCAWSYDMRRSACS